MLLLHTRQCAWGLGTGASWKHLLCCSEVHITYQTDQHDTEGNQFLSDIFGNPYYCQAYSRLQIQLFCLQSLPMALAHQWPKKKIGYNFTDGLLCLEQLFIFQIYLTSFGSQNAPLSRNSCQEQWKAVIPGYDLHLPKHLELFKQRLQHQEFFLQTELGPSNTSRR